MKKKLGPEVRSLKLVSDSEETLSTKDNYLENIFRQYVSSCDKVLFKKDIVGSDEVPLSATEYISGSQIGVVIIPGITVPRESYFRLFAYLLDFNVIVYDLRGQGDSGGEIDPDDCVRDVNFVGTQFKKQNGLKYLIGIGHSFGGMNLLESSLDVQHPYDLRIALAAPAVLSAISSPIPSFARLIAVYIYNLKQKATNHAYRDEIVRHHQPMTPISFIKNPRIVALRVKNPKAYNQTRVKTRKLTDFIKDVKLPSYLIYPDKDERLRIEGALEGDYEILSHQAKERGIKLTLIKGLSHRFNIPPEDRIMLSYNNDHALQQVRGIIDREVSS